MMGTNIMTNVVANILTDVVANILANVMVNILANVMAKILSLICAVDHFAMLIAGCGVITITEILSHITAILVNLGRVVPHICAIIMDVLP